MHRRDLRQAAPAPPKTNTLQEFARPFDVVAHNVVLFRCQRAGLGEDRFRHANLAEIVQLRRQADELHAFGFQSQLPRQQHSTSRHTGGVPRRLRVTSVQRGAQGVDEAGKLLLHLRLQAHRLDGDGR